MALTCRVRGGDIASSETGTVDGFAASCQNWMWTAPWELKTN